MIRTIIYGNVVNAYLDAPDLLEDKFEVIKENGNLRLKTKQTKPICRWMFIINMCSQVEHLWEV